MGSTSLRAEVERQLSDTNFYQQQDHDFTIDNDNTVKRVVKEAISQHGTTRLCYQHLIVDSPCTFKLFRPKPTNPERPQHYLRLQLPNKTNSSLLRCYYHFTGYKPTKLRKRHLTHALHYRVRLFFW